MFEKTVKKIEAFRGKLLTLEQHDVELKDGMTAYREIIRHPGAVGVLARHPDGRFIFVRQFRKAVEAVMTEVVAGLLDPGEAPEAAAARELAEETGYRAARLTHLGTVYASPGYVDEKIEIFLADLDPEAGATDHDRDERIELAAFTRADFTDMIRAGAILDGKTLAAWALFREAEE